MKYQFSSLALIVVAVSMTSTVVFADRLIARCTGVSEWLTANVYAKTKGGLRVVIKKDNVVMCDDTDVTRGYIFPGPGHGGIRRLFSGPQKCEVEIRIKSTYSNGFYGAYIYYPEIGRSYGPGAYCEVLEPIYLESSAPTEE